jgi:hypothetical protein
VISLFNRLFVKTGKVDKQLGVIVKDARRSREMADYTELAEFSREEAEGQITDAEVFISRRGKLHRQRERLTAGLGGIEGGHPRLFWLSSGGFRMVDAAIVTVVRDYLRALREYGLDVRFGVVFGSWSRGAASEWSDIDLLVISPPLMICATVRTWICYGDWLRGAIVGSNPFRVVRDNGEKTGAARL